MWLFDLFDSLFTPCTGAKQCVKNPKKFLFFNWYGNHMYERTGLVKPWGALDWRRYEVQVKCSECDVTKYFFGIDEATLVRNRVPIEKLAECREKDDWIDVRQK